MTKIDKVLAKLPESQMPSFKNGIVLKASIWIIIAAFCGRCNCATSADPSALLL